MNKKKIAPKWLLLCGVIAGVVFIAISNHTPTTAVNEADEICYYSKELEKRVTELILRMEDVEQASVLITLENSGEAVYAQNQLSGSTEYVIFTSGEGEQVLKLQEINPKVRGVAVVCTNGNDISIRERITSMLSSALGIPTNRITVAE